MNSGLREALAKLAHDQWSEWMDYLFSRSEKNEYGQVIVPAAMVQRWERQMKTFYEDLSEKEKESYRLEADRMIEVFSRYYEP